MITSVSKTDIALTAYSMELANPDQESLVRDHVTHMAWLADLKGQSREAYVQSSLHKFFNWNAFFTEEEATRCFTHLRTRISSLMDELAQ
jgi:hypothetical protein